MGGQSHNHAVPKGEKEAQKSTPEVTPWTCPRRAAGALAAPRSRKRRTGRARALQAEAPGWLQLRCQGPHFLLTGRCLAEGLSLQQRPPRTESFIQAAPRGHGAPAGHPRAAPCGGGASPTRPQSGRTAKPSAVDFQRAWSFQSSVILVVADQCSRV